jgi:hypothetical protein
MATLVTAVVASWVGVASATTVHEHSPQNLSGPVTAVNGAHGAGACGSSGSTGSFVVRTRDGSFTVNVVPTTVFEEHRARASFADVCVGDQVRASGPIATNNVVTASQVTVIPPAPQHIAGTVATVNGTGAASACGVRGTSGSFTVPSGQANFTVSVTPATVFQERGQHEPSFADVCVGDKVRVAGPISPAGVVAASQVTVIPTPPEHVAGTVTTVDGSSSVGACGVRGTSGSFTVPSHGALFTVDVTTSTTFKERGVGSASFSDVCVGAKVRAVGPISPESNTVAALGVVVIPPRPQHVTGIVSLVGGSTAAGSCGMARTSGQFSVPWHGQVLTVDVSASTPFAERGVLTPTFADVCVGAKVRVAGPVSPADVDSASRVTVIPPRQKTKKVSGTVVSVNGSSTEGTCGTTGNSGSFSISSHRSTQTVAVAPSTVFSAHGVSAPSFHVVCVGDSVRVSGNQGPNSAILTATDVLVTDQPAQTGRR